MKVECKYEFEQHLRHRLSGFQGHVTGVVIRPSGPQYELMPSVDNNGAWRDEKWIPERYLEPVEEKKIGIK